MSKKIRLAVVSDLHCHPEEARFKDNDSYLFTDSLRANEHPVESLRRNFKDTEVDLIIAPGDFTNMANKQGFISGWNYVLEIKKILKANDIVATLGNHDVDSGNNYSDYSLEIAKGIKQDFPLKDELQQNEFWSKGCTFYEQDFCRILVINSCHFHYSRKIAGSGKVDEDMLNYIDSYLEDKIDGKIQIALVHHHPIDHSRQKLGEYDKIVNADDLLNLLGKYKFDLIIHGHKHDPLLRYYNTTQTSFKIPVFSSGSFASSSNNLWCGARNFFHIIEIGKDEDIVSGEIHSWTYFPQNGWKFIYDESAFPPYSGFGNNLRIQEILEKIYVFMDTPSKDWSELQSAVPEVKYLIPQEMEELHRELKNRGFFLDAVIGNFPQKIFKAF